MRHPDEPRLRLCMCFMVPLLTSADVLFTRHFSPALVFQALHEMDISVFPAVPVMLDSLLAIDATYPVKRPRIVLSAGAPLSPCAGADGSRSGMLPMKVVLRCREHARRVYYCAVFEAKKEIPVEVTS